MVALSSVPARELPVNRLASLIDAKGVRDSWRDLLYAFVVNGSGANSASIVGDAFFDGAETVDNLLEGLSVGNIGVLYEYSLAYADSDDRKASGQYFTPDDVAQFMARKAVNRFSDDSSVWMDPCSGVGNLIFWLLQEFHETGINIPDFMRNRIYVIDRDPLALMVCRVLLVSHFQESLDKDLFRDVEDRFVVQDFLDTERELPHHDFSIVNPPYLRTSADDRFYTAKSTDLYSFFLERILFNANQGFVSITPQSFTNASKFSPLRELFNEYADTVDIYCFDNVPDAMFRGVKYGSKNTNQSNSTRAAITVFKKSSDTSSKLTPSSGLFNSVDNAHIDSSAESGFRITPLLRWKSAQRAEMFARADEFLSEFTPTREKYPKLSKGTMTLYTQCANMPTVGALFSGTPTEYKLTVPSSPRYFTPALKREVSRSSAHVLYFPTQEAIDHAYVLLNSSLLYWWWRVNDGGMTLSYDTLRSVPLIGIGDRGEEAEDITRRLEESEHENIVVKENAGKSNENVKHPFSLIEDVNRLVIPGYSQEVRKFHQSTVL